MKFLDASQLSQETQNLQQATIENIADLFFVGHPGIIWGASLEVDEGGSKVFVTEGTILVSTSTKLIVNISSPVELTELFDTSVGSQRYRYYQVYAKAGSTQGEGIFEILPDFEAQLVYESSVLETEIPCTYYPDKACIGTVAFDADQSQFTVISACAQKIGVNKYLSFDELNSVLNANGYRIINVGSPQQAGDVLTLPDNPENLNGKYLGVKSDVVGFYEAEISRLTSDVDAQGFLIRNLGAPQQAGDVLSLLDNPENLNNKFLGIRDGQVGFYESETLGVVADYIIKEPKDFRIFTIENLLELREKFRKGLLPIPKDDDAPRWYLVPETDPNDNPLDGGRVYGISSVVFQEAEYFDRSQGKWVVGNCWVNEETGYPVYSVAPPEGYVDWSRIGDNHYAPFDNTLSASSTDKKFGFPSLPRDPNTGRKLSLVYVLPGVYLLNSLVDGSFSDLGYNYEPYDVISLDEWVATSGAYDYSGSFYINSIFHMGHPVKLFSSTPTSFTVVLGDVDAYELINDDKRYVVTAATLQTDTVDITFDSALLPKPLKPGTILIPFDEDTPSELRVEERRERFEKLLDNIENVGMLVVDWDADNSVAKVSVESLSVSVDALSSKRFLVIYFDGAYTGDVGKIRRVAVYGDRVRWYDPYYADYVLNQYRGFSTGSIPYYFGAASFLTADYESGDVPLITYRMYGDYRGIVEDGGEVFLLSYYTPGRIIKVWYDGIYTHFVVNFSYSISQGADLKSSGIKMYFVGADFEKSYEVEGIYVGTALMFHSLSGGYNLHFIGRAYGGGSRDGLSYSTILIMAGGDVNLEATLGLAAGTPSMSTSSGRIYSARSISGTIRVVKSWSDYYTVLTVRTASSNNVSFIVTASSSYGWGIFTLSQGTGQTNVLITSSKVRTSVNDRNAFVFNGYGIVRAQLSNNVGITYALRLQAMFAGSNGKQTILAQIFNSGTYLGYASSSEYTIYGYVDTTSMSNVDSTGTIYSQAGVV